MITIPLVQSKIFEPLCAGLGFGIPIQKKLWGFDHVFQSLVGYYLPMLILQVIQPKIKIVEQAPTWWKLCFSIVFGLLVYDFIFFWVHIGMHKIEKLQFIHKKHHLRNPLVASDSLNHGYIDGTMQVMTNIVMLNLIRAHPLHRILHNIIIAYMFCETHSGYDLPWMIHNIVPFNILGGSVRHELHHKYGNNFFQQFFTYLDNFFGYNVQLEQFEEINTKQK